MKGFTFISIAMFIIAYGATVGYLIIIKSNLSDLLGVDDDDVVMKNAALTISSLMILYPISLQRVS
jgi:amino acid permease